MRTISLDIAQRREGVTIDGRYWYFITTVIVGASDSSTGTPIQATTCTDEPLLSLFVLDATAAESSGAAPGDVKLCEDMVINKTIATPEDFTVGESLYGSTPFLQLPRLFFPSETSTDPTTGTPVAPKDLTLADLIEVTQPTGGGGCPAPAAVTTVSPYYASNVRVDVYPTVESADIAAATIRNAVEVFVQRYNSIAQSFGTSESSDINGYRKYNF